MNVKDLIREVYRLEEQIQGLESIYKKSKEKIQEFFDKKAIKELEVDDDGDGISLLAKRIDRVYIDYSAPKLKEKFNKERYNEIVTKEYKINDINGLITLLKKAGIAPDEFKKFIIVEETPDKVALKQAFSLGDITKEDLEGCYTARIVKSISIKPGKGDTN